MVCVRDSNGKRAQAEWSCGCDLAVYPLIITSIVLLCLLESTHQSQQLRFERFEQVEQTLRLRWNTGQPQHGMNAVSDRIEAIQRS